MEPLLHVSVVLFIIKHCASLAAAYKHNRLATVGCHNHGDRFEIKISTNDKFCVKYPISNRINTLSLYVKIMMTIMLLLVAVMPLSK